MSTPYRETEFAEPRRMIDLWPQAAKGTGFGAGFGVVLWIAFAIHSCPGAGERRHNAEAAAMEYARHVNNPGVSIRVQCHDRASVGEESLCVVVVNGLAAHLWCDTDDAPNNGGCTQIRDRL